MGSSQFSQQLQVQIPSKPGEWVLEGNTGYSKLVRNVKTGVLAQQYSIPSEQRVSKQQDYDIYEFRRAQNDNLVSVFQVEKEDNQYLCDGQDYIRVKTEHIPYRLSEINNLGFSEGLYILQEALIGYRAITDFVGTVTITDEMIGFTPEHKVKVWLNEEFAYNLPREGTKIQLRQKSSFEQRDPNTIAQLFDVVGEHMQNGIFPDNFERAFRQYPMQTFSEAIQFIHEYSSKEGIRERQSLVRNMDLGPIRQESQFIQKESLVKHAMTEPTISAGLLYQEPVLVTKQDLQPRMIARSMNSIQGLSSNVVQNPPPNVVQVPVYRVIEPKKVKVQRFVESGPVKKYYTTKPPLFQVLEKSEIRQNIEPPKPLSHQVQTINKEVTLKPFRASEVLTKQQYLKPSVNYQVSTASSHTRNTDLHPTLEQMRLPHQSHSQIHISQPPVHLHPVIKSPPPTKDGIVPVRTAFLKKPVSVSTQSLSVTPGRDIPKARFNYSAANIQGKM